MLFLFMFIAVSIKLHKSFTSKIGIITLYNYYLYSYYQSSKSIFKMHFLCSAYFILICFFLETFWNIFEFTFKLKINEDKEQPTVQISYLKVLFINLLIFRDWFKNLILNFFCTLGREIWWYTLGIIVLVFGGKFDFSSQYFPKYENSTHEKGTVFTYQLNLF